MKRVPRNVLTVKVKKGNNSEKGKRNTSEENKLQPIQKHKTSSFKKHSLLTHEISNDESRLSIIKETHSDKECKLSEGQEPNTDEKCKISLLEGHCSKADTGKKLNTIEDYGQRIEMEDILNTVGGQGPRMETKGISNTKERLEPNTDSEQKLSPVEDHRSTMDKEQKLRSTEGSRLGTDTERWFSHAEHLRLNTDKERRFSHNERLSPNTDKERRFSHNERLSPNTDKERRFSHNERLSPNTDKERRFSHNERLSPNTDKERRFSHNERLSPNIDKERRFSHNERLSPNTDKERRFSHVERLKPGTYTERRFSHTERLSPNTDKERRFSHNERLSPSTDTERRFSHAEHHRPNMYTERRFSHSQGHRPSIYTERRCSHAQGHRTSTVKERRFNHAEGHRPNTIKEQSSSHDEGHGPSTDKELKLSFVEGHGDMTDKEKKQSSVRGKRRKQDKSRVASRLRSSLKKEEPEKSIPEMTVIPVSSSSDDIFSEMPMYDVDDSKKRRLRTSIREELDEIFERVLKSLQLGGFDDEQKESEFEKENEFELSKERRNLMQDVQEYVADCNERFKAVSQVSDWIELKKEDLIDFIKTFEKIINENEMDMTNAEEAITQILNEFAEKKQHMAIVGNYVLAKIRHTIDGPISKSLAHINVLGEKILMSSMDKWNEAANKIKAVLNEAYEFVEAAPLKSALHNSAAQFNIMMKLTADKFAELTESNEKLTLYGSENIVLRKMHSKDQTEIENLKHKLNEASASYKEQNLRLSQSVYMNEKLMSQVFKLRANVITLKQMLNKMYKRKEEQPSEVVSQINLAGEERERTRRQSQEHSKKQKPEKGTSEYSTVTKLNSKITSLEEELAKEKRMVNYLKLVVNMKKKSHEMLDSGLVASSSEIRISESRSSINNRGSVTPTDEIPSLTLEIHDNRFENKSVENLQNELLLLKGNVLLTSFDYIGVAKDLSVEDEILVPINRRLSCDDVLIPMKDMGSVSHDLDSHQEKRDSLTLPIRAQVRFSRSYNVGDKQERRNSAISDSSENLKRYEHQLSGSFDHQENVLPENQQNVSVDNNKRVPHDKARTVSPEFQSTSHEYPRRFSADYPKGIISSEPPRRYSADYPKSISSEPPRRYSADYPKSISSEYPRRFSADYPKSISSEHQQNISVDNTEIVPPEQARSVSPEFQRSVSPEYPRRFSADYPNISPEHQQNIPEDETETVPPKQERHLLPELETNLSSERPRRFSADYPRNVVPEQARSLSPERPRSFSLGYEKSILSLRTASPGSQRSDSPEPEKSITPESVSSDIYQKIPSKPASYDNILSDDLKKGLKYIISEAGDSTFQRPASEIIVDKYTIRSDTDMRDAFSFESLTGPHHQERKMSLFVQKAKTNLVEEVEGKHQILSLKTSLPNQKRREKMETTPVVLSDITTNEPEDDISKHIPEIVITNTSVEPNEGTKDKEDSAEGDLQIKTSSKKSSELLEKEILLMIKDCANKIQQAISNHQESIYKILKRNHYERAATKLMSFCPKTILKHLTDDAKALTESVMKNTCDYLDCVENAIVIHFDNGSEEEQSKQTQDLNEKSLSLSRNNDIGNELSSEEKNENVDAIYKGLRNRTITRELHDIGIKLTNNPKIMTDHRFLRTINKLILSRAMQIKRTVVRIKNKKVRKSCTEDGEKLSWNKLLEMYKYLDAASLNLYFGYSTKDEEYEKLKTTKSNIMDSVYMMLGEIFQEAGVDVTFPKSGSRAEFMSQVISSASISTFATQRSSTNQDHNPTIGLTGLHIQPIQVTFPTKKLQVSVNVPSYTRKSKEMRHGKRILPITSWM